ncbi:Uncharacterized membrane protein [Halobacillus dabanensis]|uniref:Uncharacterized membrane protein n=1 Tax=Halobacillus dabanensis TaxID=240302 RepID=A0A1I3TWA0_HALDA|nr:DUF2207 domain-containing protein [Halobacillus dabanensis]SFJ75534.1 Uncharacterized membrane protein [Halobacillus dabanensis]
MKKRLGAFLFILLVFFPTQAFAVEFTIADTDIHAKLLSDGNVEVKETHTYKFDGEFNGITRTLIPKEKSAITNVHASENGTELPVEQEENLYKIHRSGSDESITIELFYTIQNGVEVFEDVGQFYWPFFDESNESSYQNMTITIEPPEPADIKAAYGFDAAYETVSTTEDGKVVFHLGTVDSGENGDIRAAYDAALFSNAPVKSFEPMLEEIQADKKQMDEIIAARAETSERWGNFALYFSAALFILVLTLLISAARKRSETGREVDRRRRSVSGFPKEKMSLPAMMSFTNHGHLPTSALTASLLDLVLKGNIEKVTEEEFKLVHRDTDYKHEHRLITWLFDEIASSDTLHLEDVETYAEDKSNHEKYQLRINAWKEEVKQELQQYTLVENAPVPRFTAAIAALVTLPFIFLFPYYDLFLWMFVSISLFLFFTGFSIAYRPLNEKGRMIKEQLYPIKISDDWKSWEEEDQVPALLYQIGMGKRDLLKTTSPSLAPSNGDWMMFLILGASIQESFQSADKHATVSASSGGVSGGGAGVGGGGGGSGAF